MRRHVLSVLGGLATAVVVIGVIQGISSVLYPPPADLDIGDREAMREYMAQLPIGALLMVLLSYTAGSFAGGLVAGWLGREGERNCALAVGGILMVAGVANLVSVPQPVWFAIVSLLVFVPMAYLGGRLVGSNQVE